MAKLILFDFDGTLTTRDTLLEFTKFGLGASRHFAGLAWLSPMLVMERLGWIAAQTAKEKFLAHYLGGTSVEQFNTMCRSFGKERVPQLIRVGASKEIEKGKAEGARMVIVSASPENWIRPWAETQGLEVIATRLKIEHGKITGKIDGLNCNGPEKVNRIRQTISLDEYSTIAAFGDSHGDLPMLALATEKHFKPFR